jgi:SAM-dependent methyltransferase
MTVRTPPTRPPGRNAGPSPRVYPSGMDRPPAPRAFDVAYEGTPSWETGRPQPAVTRLMTDGVIGSAVLDAGCGTGLHAVLLAARGHRVAGIDLAARAVELARARARDADVRVDFEVGDARDLASHGPALGAPFDTVLDVGLFHVLQPSDRRPYALALASVVRPGGSGFIVVWSDRNPLGVGPARVHRRELRQSFRAAEGWRVEAIEPAILETRLPGGQVHAWLARLRRR